MKAVRRLDITLDVGSFFGSGQSVPVTMHGTALTSIRVPSSWAPFPLG